MKKFSCMVFTLLLYSCKTDQPDNEQKIFERVDFIYQLKESVGTKFWQTFNDTAYDLPLIYFTDSSSYIANPTQKFLKTFSSSPVFSNNKIHIYKTKQRVDSQAFHMETGMTLGDVTDAYNYHFPFMKCSSYEDVHQKITKVTSTEQWITMIMHEYFHGYQYRHKPYIEFYEKEIVMIQPDSLIGLYQNNHWYKKSIDQENQCLLKALAETNPSKTIALVREFIKSRTQRRKIVSERYRLDISKYEKCYETMEGTVRYAEFSMYQIFAGTKPDHNLLKSDSSFKSFGSFRNYNIKNDEWLYLTEKTSYFYATGFNMARLLDKLKIDFKSRLFKEGSISLEDILSHAIITS